MSKVVRLKGSRDLVGTVVTKLNLSKPRKKEALLWEVSRSSVEILSKVNYKLTTGLEPLDEALGGGFPFGRLVELYGLEGAGKTALVTCLAARLQGRHILRRVQTGHLGDQDFSVVWQPLKDSVEVFTLYIDNEQSLEEDEKLVVDGKVVDVVVARVDTVDQMFKMVDVTISAIDEVADAEHPCFILILVDTIAGTSSREEMGSDWDKEDFSRQAKDLREGFRIMMRKINQRNVLMVCTNQVSAVIGQNQKKRRFGGSFLPRDEDFSTFGGRALKFFASLRVFIYKVNSNYKLHKDQTFPAGFVSAFVTVKNRIAKPMRSGRFVLLFDRGLNNLYSKLEMMIFLKLCATDEDESEKVLFRFRKFGVKTKTFKAEEGQRSEPRLESRAQWPAFYEEHKEDVEALWACGKALLFSDDMPKELGVGDATDEDLALVEGEPD